VHRGRVASVGGVRGQDKTLISFQGRGFEHQFIAPDDGMVEVLDLGDAAELAEMLTFLASWLPGSQKSGPQHQPGCLRRPPRLQLEHPGYVLEALGLACLAQQTEQRVGDQVNQPERTADLNLRHVGDGDRDRLSARLGPQPLEHRFGGVNALHDHSTAGQAQRDPAGHDRQFQYPAAAGQHCDEVNSWRRVKSAIARG